MKRCKQLDTVPSKQKKETFKRLSPRTWHGLSPLKVCEGRCETCRQVQKVEKVQKVMKTVKEMVKKTVKKKGRLPTVVV